MRRWNEEKDKRKEKNEKRIGFFFLPLLLLLLLLLTAYDDSPVKKIGKVSGKSQSSCIFFFRLRPVVCSLVKTHGTSETAIALRMMSSFVIW